MTDTRQGTGSRRQALGAFLCSLAYVAYALLARDISLHDSGPGGFAASTLVLEAAAGLLVLAALVLGFRGVSSAYAGTRTLSLGAIALTSPALGDALTWLAECAGSTTGRSLFLVLSGLPMALAMLRAWRAAGAGDEANGNTGQTTRTWLGRCALVIASMAVALLLCEVAFRIWGPRRLQLPKLLVPGSETTSLSRIALMRPYGDKNATNSLSTRFPPYMFMKGWYDKPEWDYFDSEGCVDYVFNRHGLRDDDFDIEKQDGELRVVGIGDSFTFGVGVQREHIWTEVLERKLEEVHSGPVEVINAGFVSGHTPAGYEQWLTADGMRLKPDIVIVGLCLNDLHPGIDLYAYRTVKPNTVLRGHSKLLTHLRRRKLMENPQPRAYAGLIRLDPIPMETTMAALERTRDTLEAAGIRFLVAAFPMVSGLADEVYPYGKVMDLLVRSCEERGLEVIDLRDGFLGREDRALWVHPTDQHPNDIGHRLLGEGIFRHLQQP